MSVIELNKVEDILKLPQDVGEVRIEGRKVLYYLYVNSDSQRRIQQRLNVEEVRKKYVDMLRMGYSKKNDELSDHLILSADDITKIKVIE